MSDKPRNVKIGPHIYQILWSKESWLKNLSKKEADDFIGHTIVRPNKILVNGWECSESMQKETLLHEIMHACFAVAGYSDMPELNLNHFNTEEMLIRLLSPLLFQVFQENPKVKEYLFS